VKSVADATIDYTIAQQGLEQSQTNLASLRESAPYARSAKPDPAVMLRVVDAYVSQAISCEKFAQASRALGEALRAEAGL
jgi:hypothetical protein